MTTQSMTKETDIPKLVAKAKRKPIAFADLYDHYSKSIYRYLYSRVGNPSDAEDLTSQTFLTAFEKLPRYREQGQFRAWIFTIARNKARDHFRKKTPQLMENELEGPTPHTDMLTTIIQTEQLREIAKLIQDLPAKEQELLRLRYVAELSFEEMATILGKSTEATKKSLYRLQGRLQRKMEAKND